MVFSSFEFLFIFFPLFFISFYLLDPRYRNFLVLAVSLLFYAVGEGPRLLILLLSIVGNYSFGYAIKISKTRLNLKISKLSLSLGIGFNLALLAYYKYADFFIQNLNASFHDLGSSLEIQRISETLPLGISFFAFQGISYLIDIYRGTIVATSSLFTFATYKAMFPQLIAGPIVRYADISNDMHDRRVNGDEVFAGLGRFIMGLAKKVLIADTLAVTADSIFSLPSNQLGFGTAWLGVVAYTLQIYFDFSGYSDMAIGMGRMMGFKYPENFNYPYTAKSITEFWRRWHMTLSSWFRDYVYIPLGGNRVSTIRNYGNLIAVFALTGLWHGASWTFVVWGLWHGFFMLLERRFNNISLKLPLPLRNIYVVLVVMVGWTIFRADSSVKAIYFLKAMIGYGEVGELIWPIWAFIDLLVILAVLAGILFSFPTYRKIRSKLLPQWEHPILVTSSACLLLMCALRVLAGSYSPFLYFRF